MASILDLRENIIREHYKFCCKQFIWRQKFQAVGDKVIAINTTLAFHILEGFRGRWKAITSDGVVMNEEKYFKY